MVFLVTPDYTGRACFSTVGSEYDTVLHARTACGNVGQELACQDDGGLGNIAIGIRSAITVNTTEGVPFLVFVDGYGNGQSGPYQLNSSRDACADTPPARCNEAVPCDDEQACIEGQCLPLCNDANPCRFGQACIEGLCLDQ